MKFTHKYTKASLFLPAWVVSKDTNGKSFWRQAKVSARGELGHSLGALGHGVLCELAGQDEAHCCLDLPGGHCGLLVVASLQAQGHTSISQEFVSSQAGKYQQNFERFCISQSDRAIPEALENLHSRKPTLQHCCARKLKRALEGLVCGKGDSAEL